MQDYKTDLNLNDIYSSGFVNVPKFVLENFTFVGLSHKEMWLYMLLLGTNQTEVEIDSLILSNKTNGNIMEIMDAKQKMVAKNFLTIGFKENGCGKITEFINCSEFLPRFIETYNENTYKTKTNKMKHLFEQTLDIEIESIEKEPELSKIVSLNYSEEELNAILGRCKKENILSIKDIYELLLNEQ